MIGLVLGNRYEILEEVGKGGMANVFKARCNLLNRMVAVKVLRRDLEADGEFLKRFNVEAQAAASLVHPNIVSIFDFGYDQGYHYIVMEYIDGITLKQYINDNAPLDYKDALAIAYQICDALSAAHDKKIVHRDIKPHNIMITADRRIKVTDFGIARASDGSTMTADNDILGSVHYISPEQAKGAPVDGKSDLYSVGVVMYEMLTGRVPFESESPVAVAMRHINDAPVKPSEYNLEITSSIEKMVLKSIAKDITGRYQSAQDFMKDIMKLLENPDALLDIEDEDDEIDNMDSTIKIKATDVEKFKAESEKNERESEINSDSSERRIRELRERNRKDEKVDSGNKKLVLGALLTAVILVGSVSFLVARSLFPDAAIFNMFEAKKVYAPEFVNMHIDDARRLASSSDVMIEVEKEIEDDSVKEGTVLKQDPPKGTEIQNGDVIYLTVSVGVEKIKVNNVKLMKQELAKATLEGAGFHVVFDYANDEDVPENYVISQDPAADTKVAHGSTIKLVISNGPEETEVVVPTVVGKTLEQAKSALENEGLKFGEITYEKSVVDKGTVIKQTIPGGETVERNTVVNLVVSSGEEKAPVEEDKKDDTPVNETIKYTVETDKSEVNVKVVEGDETIYDGMFNTELTKEFSLRVSGTGSKTYEIYVDGEFKVAKTIVFTE